MRRLGKSGLSTAPLALGTNVFGRTVDNATAFELLDAFVAEGFNLIDTGNVYGRSESIIGDWLRRRPAARSKILLATKVGFSTDERRRGLSRARIEEVEQSLHRLGTDNIDLYQSHVDDPLTPLEETPEAYTQLIKDGKVRAIGASNTTKEHLSQALQTSARLGLARYETLEPLYNLYHRQGFETEFAALCAQEELGVTPYLPLASGFLTGKHRSHNEFAKTKRGAFAKALFDTTSLFGPRGQRILAALDQVGTDIGATPAEVAIAWLAHRVTAPVVSATTVEQLRALMRGATRELPSAATRLLDEASAADAE